MRKLDTIDLRILAELQRDGRLSNVALAKIVGLSPTPCTERVRALEAAFLADVDLPASVGRIAGTAKLTGSGNSLSFGVTIQNLKGFSYDYSLAVTQPGG